MQEVDQSFVFGLAGPISGYANKHGCDIVSADSRLLAEISEFRGKVLYAEGRRPDFQLSGGRYADEDPQDLESFHVTVRQDDRLIACIRITPHFHRGTFIGRMIGAEELNVMLRNMQLTGTDCVEAGRWIVLPSARGSGLARTVLLSCWVIGRWLNKRRLFGLAGTRDGQAKMIGRSGGEIVPGMDCRRVPHLDDDLSLVYFDLDRPPPSVAMKLPFVESLLHLRRDAGDCLLTHAAQQDQ